MPLDISASKEIHLLSDVKKRKNDLDIRMDEEFSLYRGDTDVYDIPSEEGEWEQIITNRALVEANRIIDDLTYACRKLWIPTADEDHRGEAALSATEYTAIGILYLADMINEDSPMSSEIQSLLTSYRVLRGWSAIRFILREEDDKLIPDVAIWDTRNVYWIEGKKRIIKAWNIRYATAEQIKDEYHGWTESAPQNEPDSPASAQSGLIPIYDVWDCSEQGKPAEEGVIIGNEYVKEPEKVKVGTSFLDYIPVRIKAGRSLALIHDTEHDDNIKYVGQSYITNNRNLYALESRLLSYQMTRAGQLAKAPLVIEWDSRVAPIPPAFEQDPSVKGRTILLDAAKGQKLAEQLTPPGGAEIMEVYNSLLGLLGIGGMNPVAFGRINQSLPAQGIDILSHAAMAVEMAFKKGVENDFVWLAGEAVRQYKNGNFKEYEFEGYDKSNNSFYAKVKPKDINENWRFVCQLIPDLIRDKAAMINIASSAVKSGIYSPETAREQFQLVVNNDLEEKKIAKAKFRELVGADVVEGIMAYVEDYATSLNKGDLAKRAEAKFKLDFAMMNLSKVMGQQAPAVNGSEPAQQVVNNNQMTARTAQPTIPPEVIEAARREGNA